ncbi:glycosyltransferase [Archaeoglobus neptunius]|uniref:glycosyltransferase n=1 Tax=Archaeoglobus neptunius TaxID=2798580 RepID=UPI001927399E|nr:glycosyltransferase family 2 protein [Archaeoglobus neptunius]
MKSVVITSYRDAGFLEENVRLLRDKVSEIIVAADEPDEEIIEVINKYGLKASLSDERRGKWKALNDALELVRGDHIIFLDSDTLLVDLSGLNGHDVVEIVKEVRGDSFVERLVNIDYLVMSIGSKIASKFGSCLGINGSAFVVRKKVFDKLGGFRRRVNEDTDFGVRVGLSGFTFSLCGKAYTNAPKNFKEWFRQRERWSLGGAEVLIENFLHIIIRPKLWLPYLFFFYPAIFSLIVTSFLPDSYLFKLFYLLLPVVAILSPKLASIAILTVYEVETLKNILAMLASFSAWAVVIAAGSKKMDFKIDFKLLPFYYFIYSPLWTTVCFVSLMRVLGCKLLGKKIEVNGWKV